MQQESLGFLLVDASRLLRRAFGQRLAGSSLTLAQARALVYVSRNEGIRQVDLAELLEVQPITLARLIDQLTDSGLVERRPDASDRRAYRLFLLPAAAPHLQAIEKVAADIRAAALQGVSDQDATVVFAVLAKIRENLTTRQGNS